MLVALCIQGLANLDKMANSSSIHVVTANQRNYNYFTYTDDNAAAWNKRGTVDTATNALDGSSALTAGARVWIDTKRHQTRKAVFQDPTTFRTVKITVYTPTAFAALTGSSTLAVNVPGNTASVTYNLAEKIGEKQPIAKTSRQLTDHP